MSNSGVICGAKSKDVPRAALPRRPPRRRAANGRRLRQRNVDLIKSNGGTVTNDLTNQIGVLFARSSNPLFAETLEASALVEGAGEDFSVKVFPSRSELLASRATIMQGEGGGAGQAGGCTGNARRDR
jgi:hypothetical protein